MSEKLKRITSVCVVAWNVSAVFFGSLGLLGLLAQSDPNSYFVLGFELTPVIRSAIYTVMIVDGWRRLSRAYTRDWAEIRALEKTLAEQRKGGYMTSIRFNRPREGQEEC